MNDRFERAVDRVLKSRNVSSNVAVTPEKRDSNELPWQPYSHELLSKYTAAGKTVFVDFTADWRLTCKANEAVAINKRATKQLVEANDVVTLKADKTQPAPEVDELLQHLGNKAGSIPFYAVFPAGDRGHADRPSATCGLRGLSNSERQLKSGASRIPIPPTPMSSSAAIPKWPRACLQCSLGKDSTSTRLSIRETCTLSDIGNFSHGAFFLKTA